MPCYYFHVRRGQVTVLDHQGAELANAAQAEVEARRWVEQVDCDGRANGGRIIVADDNWRTLFECSFAEMAK